MSDAKAKVKQAAERARWGIEKSDAVVRKLEIPIMTTALALQDDIFSIADGLGLGEEARAVVYGLRTVQYAGSLAQNFAPGAATAAATSLASLGAMGALGVAGVMGAALFGAFGGESDSDKRRRVARYRQSRASLLLLLKRLDMNGLIQEQENQRQLSAFSAQMSFMFGPKVAETARKREAKAAKMIQFYRQIQKTLPAAEVDLFVALTNLGRWTAARASYGKMSNEQRTQAGYLLLDAKPLDFITKRVQVPSIAALLDKLIEAETRTVARMKGQPPPPRKGALVNLRHPTTRSSATKPRGVAAVAAPAALGLAAGFALGPVGGLIAAAAGYVLGIGR